VISARANLLTVQICDIVDFFNSHYGRERSKQILGLYLANKLKWLQEHKTAADRIADHIRRQHERSAAQNSLAVASGSNVVAAAKALEASRLFTRTPSPLLL
jgi:hypothetical protein